MRRLVTALVALSVLGAVVRLGALGFGTLDAKGDRP